MNNLSNHTNIIGFAAGVILIISYIPQLIKIIYTKSAKDISLPMYFLILASEILWVAYGFLQKDIQIIWVNISCIVITLCILVVTIFTKYKNTIHKTTLEDTLDGI
jgi:MtN3 and saliva related transmembrane protein